MSTDDDVVGIAVEAAQPGGAAVGRVDDAGERSAVLLGKRVLVGPFEACGQCEVCRRGGATVCPLATRRTGVTARLRVHGRWLVALADGLELPVPAAAAVAGDVTTAYTLYGRTGLGPREPAVVTGATGVTRFLVEVLLAKAITPTVVVATEDAWSAWLLAKGAAVVRADGDVRAAVTAAIAAQGVGARPWRVLATGDIALAASLAGPRATLTVLADGTALPGELMTREVTAIGVAGPHPDLVVEAAAMCVKGELDLVGGTTTADDDPTRARVTDYRATM